MIIKREAGSLLLLLKKKMQPKSMSCNYKLPSSSHSWSSWSKCRSVYGKGVGAPLTCHEGFHFSTCGQNLHSWDSIGILSWAFLSFRTEIVFDCGEPTLSESWGWDQDWTAIVAFATAPYLVLFLVYQTNMSFLSKPTWARKVSP